MIDGGQALGDKAVSFRHDHPDKQPIGVEQQKIEGLEIGQKEDKEEENG